MSIRITYLQFVAMAAFMLVFLGCSSDDEPTPTCRRRLPTANR